jgi:hypothetical protein
VAFEDHVQVLRHPRPLFLVQQAFQPVCLLHLVFPVQTVCLVQLAFQEALLLREALQGIYLVQLDFQVACLAFWQVEQLVFSMV